MNLRPDEPPNGDFVAYVESLVNRASQEHAAQRRDLTPPQTPKASGKPRAAPAAQPKPTAPVQAAARALPQAGQNSSAEQAIEQALSKAKGWMVKAAIGAVALFVLLPRLIDWWDETEDPSSVGVLLVLGFIALRWWLANRHS